VKRYFITGGLVVVLLGVIAVRILRHTHPYGLLVGVVPIKHSPIDTEVTIRHIRLQIFADGSLFLNLIRVSAGELPRRLNEIYTTRKWRELYVDAGDSISYQQAITAIDMAQSAVPDLKIILITPNSNKREPVLRIFPTEPGAEIQHRSRKARPD
jgi:biopolymer transport protein ExbD